MEWMLIPALTFLAVLLVGGAVVAHRQSARVPLHARLQEIEQEFRLPSSVAPLRRMTQVLHRIGQIVSSGRVSRSLREELIRAGYHHKSAPMVYLGVKILLSLTGLVTASMLLLPGDLPFATQGLLAITAAFSLFMLPNAAVALRHSQRRRRVRTHLPDAVDLLEICVSAGMGMDMAWNVVGGEIRHVCPVLADEMALVNLEIHLGAPRVEAMRHLAERTGVSEIDSLVAVLVQSERFGTSVAEALRVFATSMRETRSSRAEETAEKMTVRMLVPMILFVFPAMFVVAVGPALIGLVRTLGK
jgi:tight adherence protein C